MLEDDETHSEDEEVPEGSGTYQALSVPHRSIVVERLYEWLSHQAERLSGMQVYVHYHLDYFLAHLDPSIDPVRHSHTHVAAPRPSGNKALPWGCSPDFFVPTFFNDLPPSVRSTYAPYPAAFPRPDHPDITNAGEANGLSMKAILATLKLTDDQFEVRYSRQSLLPYSLPSRGERIKWATKGFGKHPDDAIVWSDQDK